MEKKKVIRQRQIILYFFGFCYLFLSGLAIWAFSGLLNPYKDTNSSLIKIAKTLKDKVIKLDDVPLTETKDPNNQNKTIDGIDIHNYMINDQTQQPILDAQDNIQFKEIFPTPQPTTFMNRNTQTDKWSKLYLACVPNGKDAQDIKNREELLKQIIDQGYKYFVVDYCIKVKSTTSNQAVLLTDTTKGYYSTFRIPQMNNDPDNYRNIIDIGLFYNPRDGQISVSSNNFDKAFKDRVYKYDIYGEPDKNQRVAKYTTAWDKGVDVNNTFTDNNKQFLKRKRIDIVDSSYKSNQSISLDQLNSYLILLQAEQLLIFNENIMKNIIKNYEQKQNNRQNISDQDVNDIYQNFLEPQIEIDISCELVNDKNETPELERQDYERILRGKTHLQFAPRTTGQNTVSGGNDDIDINIVKDDNNNVSGNTNAA